METHVVFWHAPGLGGGGGAGGGMCWDPMSKGSRLLFSILACKQC